MTENISHDTDENAPLADLSASDVGFLKNYWATLKIAFPVSISLLGNMAMGITDVIFIGRLGAVELAATSLSVSIYFLYFLFTIGFILASTGLISQYRGQGNDRMIRRATRQAIWIGIGFSILSIILLLNMESILRLVGQEEAISVIAGRYSAFAAIGFLPFAVFIAIRCFMIGLQHARVVAIIVWCAVPLNALLDYILIFGAFGIPPLNVEGAGLATSLAAIAQCIVIVVIAIKCEPYKKYEIFKNFFQADWEIFGKLMRLGFPLAVRESMGEAFFVVSGIMIGWIGATALAAHSIIINIIGVSFVVSIGISEACTTRVGYEFGAKNYPQVRRNGWVGMVVTTTFTLLAMAILFLFPMELVSFILDPSTENADEVLAIAASAILIAAVNQIPDGLQLSIAGSLAGVNDTKTPMYSAIICYWCLGLTAAYFLAFEMELGVAGFWYGFIIGLGASVCVNVTRFWWITAEDARLEKQQLIAQTSH